jgi:hypothetical protein
MASMTLPKEIDYFPVSALPEGTSSTSIVSTPSNGNTFTQSSIIQVDLQQRGYLVPESCYIRYRVSYQGQTAASTGITGAAIRGTPVYSFINRLETIAGSQNIESIQNYGQLANMLVNSKLAYSQKVGLAFPFGYNLQSGAGAGFDNAVSAPNGGYITAAPGTFYSYAAPLGCILSNASKLLPLKFLPSIRLQFTLDSLANILKLDSATPANNPTGYTISNFEFVYDVVEFSPFVDQAISARGNGMLTIKSQSFLSSGTTVGAGTNGSIELVFNQRLASIKSVFLLGAGTEATKLNLSFDSVDMTSSSGSYQFVIAGTQYPTRELNTLNAKAGIFMELSQAISPAGDMLQSQFSINPQEFNYINAGGAAVGTTTVNQPGKFYIGVNTERMMTSALLTGVSSQGSPISVRISMSTAMTNAQVAQLICQYDALLQIDMSARTLVVMQ